MSSGRCTGDFEWENAGAQGWDSATEFLWRPMKHETSRREGNETELNYSASTYLRHLPLIPYVQTALISYQISLDSRFKMRLDNYNAVPFIPCHARGNGMREFDYRSAQVPLTNIAM